MRREGTTVIYTAQELKESRERGQDRTDWERVRSMTDEEIEANAEADEDSKGDWIPIDDPLTGESGQRSVLLDRDAVEWFVAQGSGYESRISQVLREYAEAHRKAS